MKTNYQKFHQGRKLLQIFILSLFFFWVSPSITCAEETLGFGVAAGRTGGTGFSVRRMPLEGFGWQAGGIYLKSTELIYGNIGAETFYILNRTKNTCLYLAGGLSYSYDRSKEELMHWVTHDSLVTETHYNTSDGFAAGAGVGVAFRYAQWDQIWFSADLLLTADKDTVLPSPQFAIHYFFR